MNNELKTNVLKDLNEFGKMCKDCIMEFDTIENPLIVQYIQADIDMMWKWDNTPFKDTHMRKCMIFAYDAVKMLLCNRYKSDNLSISYKDKKLKMVYLVNDLNVTTIL